MWTGEKAMEEGGGGGRGGEGMKVIKKNSG